MTRALLAALAAALLLAAPAVAADPQPYGTNDAGGFRNVLPPGQTGHITALQLAQNQSGYAPPPHFDDQRPLYEGLLYASPTLTPEDLPKFFKDATFGVQEGNVERTYSPRPGVTIIRDRDFGVPRIYGDTDEDVSFGAGYVAAEDRLFLIDVLRHTGRAKLSSFVGGSAGNRAMDRTQWGIAPYTEADLQKQIDNAPVLYGDLGRQLVARLEAFVAGINAYIAEARLNPNKMPGEYAAINKTPTDWKPTDVIAEASLIGGIFGKGGGNEVGSAEVLNALVERFGRKAGRRAWRDFRFKNDPEAPVTVRGRKFPYQTTRSFAKRGLALPDPGSVEDVAYGPPLEGGSARSDGSIGSQLLRTFTEDPLASNWLMVSARESASGTPIGVLGPQVGYYVPQILMEQELHGPSFDSRGAAFPGVNLMVQLGRGRDYAWSATTATSDNVDTFAEVLCEDEAQYRYKGECRPFEVLEQNNSWTPNALDQSPPGSETLTALRSVHGIVYAYGTVGGTKVAFVRARTTYFHEADSAVGFYRLNDPNFTRDAQSFRRAVGGISFLFNWGYIDAEQVAYQLSGAHPVRAKGVSNDFPILGTGEFDWQGFDPETFTSKTLSLKRRPHAIDQDYLISWNNKQARRFSSADDKFTFGPLYRSQMLERRVRAGLKGDRKMTLTELVQAMEEPATEDIRGSMLVPILTRGLGRTKGELAEAVATLRAWRKSGAHRRDLDKDGKAEDGEAIRIMDAWWPRLLDAQFGPALGEDAMHALRAMASYPRNAGEGTSPDAPAFSDGWYGYVHKDLRAIFRPRSRIRGRFSQRYCGEGRASKCRGVLRRTLKEALTVTMEELYGRGDCAEDPDSACYDMNRNISASGVGVPDSPFQNRPTFQQIVEINRRLPR